MMLLRQLAMTAGATLLAALIPTPSVAKERERCEEYALIEKVWERPPAGSGIVWFVIEISIKTTRGERWPIYATYFGQQQRLPFVGAVCRICYEMVRKQGEFTAMRPYSVPARLVTAMTCGGVDYTRN
jgi:hypothetical protein